MSLKLSYKAISIAIAEGKFDFSVSVEGVSVKVDVAKHAMGIMNVTFSKTAPVNEYFDLTTSMTVDKVLQNNRLGDTVAMSIPIPVEDAVYNSWWAMNWPHVVGEALILTGTVIIIATVIEDIATFGAGTIDDPTTVSFAIMFLEQGVETIEKIAA